MKRIALLLLLYLFCFSEALDERHNAEKTRRIADLDPKDQYWKWYNEYLEQVNNKEFYDVDTTHHYKIKKVPVSEDTRHQGGEHPGYVTLPADQQPQNTFVDGADMYNIGQPNYEAGAGGSYAVDSDGGAELEQDSELDVMEPENTVIAVDGEASAPNSDPLLSEVPLVDQESGAGLGSGQSAPKVIYPDYPLTRLNRKRTACPAGRPTSVSRGRGRGRGRKLDAPPPPSPPRAHLRGRRGLALKAVPDQSAAASAAARPKLPFAPEGDDLTPSGPVMEIPSMPPLEVSDDEFIHVSGKPKLGQQQGPAGGAGTEVETRGGRGGEGGVDFPMGRPWEDLPPGAEFPFGWSGGRR